MFIGEFRIKNLHVKSHLEMNHTYIIFLVKEIILVINEKTKVSVMFYIYSMRNNFFFPLPTAQFLLLTLYSSLPCYLFSLQRLNAGNS